ncbi:transglutaminase [Novosphingobium sp. Rr 2-17]|uniref:transglutaminase-like domain-containing protein n=1 Tax=Novosphingobium sp. Rr 2-17 TaxID=555793 RepID=UPI00026991F2|nr:transglutaminase family protein [Novosphingobium sp. Rr 2-17]EIZ79326.1 transglutaminase [Novosphingobium sp. Rr 2-17]
MQISIQTELDYALTGPGPVDALLQVEAAIIPEQRVISANIEFPLLEHFARVPAQSCIGERIWVRLSQPLRVRYQATVSVERMLAPIETLAATPTYLLPGETVDYLMPSRFCPSDTFLAFAEDQFGHLKGGPRVAAIRDWIADTLSYEPGSSDAMTTAADTFHSGRGVCRDYTHLMISLARASTIPARYASVYGVGVDPQDFHAIAEVFLDGAWHLVDATKMTTPDRVAKIGVGRDAADVSFLTSYGDLQLVSQTVQVSEALPA